MRDSLGRSTIALAALCLAALTVISFAKDKTLPLPRAFHAKTYPANDIHDDEKVAIAADPYDTADKVATAFNVKYVDQGLLPVHLIISNDGNQPVSLAEMKIVFVTKKGTKLDPARPEDIYRRIGHPRQSGPVINPLPIPRKQPRSVSEQARDEVQQAQFLAKAVEPHGTQAGFLFFDVSGIESPLAGAKLEITGIMNSDGKELFYFEIPMEKYLSYQPLK
jgi:hypothetical protein